MYDDETDYRYDLGDARLFPGNLDARYEERDNFLSDRSVILFDDPSYAGGSHAKKPQYLVSEETEGMNPYALIGPCRVVDIAYAGDTIHSHHLDELNIQDGERVLLKTDTSTDSDTREVYLTEDALTRLVERNPSLFGIDTKPSNGRDVYANQTHRRAQDRDISVVEGLQLRDVPPGNYFIVVVPKENTSYNGSTARVVLIPKD